MHIKLGLQISVLVTCRVVTCCNTPHPGVKAMGQVSQGARAPDPLLH